LANLESGQVVLENILKFEYIHNDQSYIREPISELYRFSGRSCWRDNREKVSWL